MSQALATAEWADPEDFAQCHAFANGKFWLGRSPLTGEAVGYSDDRHVCLVSGSRSGKGTTTIIPNLCLWPGSVVVVDPKGENATVTAARRGPGGDGVEGMGQAVHVLDPFGVARVDDALRSRFNPMDALDPNDPRTVDAAGHLADAIVVTNPEAKDPYWDQSARSMVKALILHVLTDPMYEGRRNLITVRQLISRGDHEGVAMLREMGEANPAPAHQLLWQGVSQNPAFNGVIAGIGDLMANTAEHSSKEFLTFLQVANRNTEFLDSPDMQACVGASDFRLPDLKTDSNGVSLYLSLPQRYMGEHFRWLRMMITLIVNEMEAAPDQPATGHRVLMCLDEFAGLKRMEVIENAVAQIAGFGVKLFFVLQSLEQLKSTYKGNWETFLANAGLKIFYGLDDHFSRKYVSDFIGETELLRELTTSNESMSQQTSAQSGTSSSETWGTQENTGYSFSDNWKAMPFFLRNTAGFFAAISGKRQANRSRNTGTSTSDGGSQMTQEGRSSTDGTTKGSGTNQSLFKRPLITPDEVGRYFGRIDERQDRLYPGMGLVLITGSSPVPLQRVNYYEDPTFADRFGTHPDHRDDAAEVVAFRFPSNEAITYCTPSVHFVKGRLVAKPGSRVQIGDPLFELDLREHYAAGSELPEFITLKSPFTGLVHSFSESGGAMKMDLEDDGSFTAYKSNARYEGLFELLIRVESTDESIYWQDDRDIRDYCRTSYKLSDQSLGCERFRAKRVIAIAFGATLVLSAISFAFGGFVCGLPVLILLGLIAAYFIRHAAEDIRNLATPRSPFPATNNDQLTTYIAPRERQLSMEHREVSKYDQALKPPQDGIEFLNKRSRKKPIAACSSEEIVGTALESVWRAAIDTRRYCNWMRGFGHYDCLPTQFTRGTVVNRSSDMMKNSDQSFCVVGDCEPPKSFVFHRQGSSIQIELRELQDGTAIRFTKRYYQSRFGLRWWIFKILNARNTYVTGEVHAELRSFCTEVQQDSS